jgi:hypothetical protein
LFKVQNALLRTNIADLVDKEQEIRSKNEQMETDLRMAMELQQALMSFNYPRFCDDKRELQFSHRYRPASMVGGDFFFISPFPIPVLEFYLRRHGSRRAFRSNHFHVASPDRSAWTPRG